MERVAGAHCAIGVHHEAAALADRRQDGDVRGRQDEGAIVGRAVEERHTIQVQLVRDVDAAVDVQAVARVRCAPKAAVARGVDLHDRHAAGAERLRMELEAVGDAQHPEVRLRIEAKDVTGARLEDELRLRLDIRVPEAQRTQAALALDVQRVLRRQVADAERPVAAKGEQLGPGRLARRVVRQREPVRRRQVRAVERPHAARRGRRHRHARHRHRRPRLHLNTGARRAAGRRHLARHTQLVAAARVRDVQHRLRVDRIQAHGVVGIRRRKVVLERQKGHDRGHACVVVDRAHRELSVGVHAHPNARLGTVDKLEVASRLRR